MWMAEMLYVLIGGLIVFAVGCAMGYLVFLFRANARIRLAEDGAKSLMEEARTKEKEIILEAKDEALRMRDEIEAENKERRIELQRQERRIQQKEENLDRKTENLERRDRNLTTKEKELEQMRQELDRMKGQQLVELERISGLTTEQAKDQILQAVEIDTRQDAARKIREIEAETREESDRRSREIIAQAIQRCASDCVAETTVSTVPLPNDDMKGRIIGREGRNIRALEQATGIDLIVDDTPEAVTLSGYDPVRREVARRALTKLILDGRIHPARIEEVVNKARQEVDAAIKEEGEKAAYEANVQGLHPDLIRLLGRLKFRTSYGQNVLAHSLETSFLAAAMAAEIGADVNLAKTAGLLHDIGKAVDHEVDGPHAQIGADIAKRLGRSPKIVHAIAAHHGEEEAQTVEAFLVGAADAISGARPGARRESVENYIKRLEALETVASSFDGVERTFAIQAGREVRIMVKPDDVDDLASIQLARDIVKKIEENLEYPGQIKVTVIRETRAVEYAK
jgi:ribonucrease Y